MWYSGVSSVRYRWHKYHVRCFWSWVHAILLWFTGAPSRMAFYVIIKMLSTDTFLISLKVGIITPKWCLLDQECKFCGLLHIQSPSGDLSRITDYWNYMGPQSSVIQREKLRPGDRGSLVPGHRTSKWLNQARLRAPKSWARCLLTSATTQPHGVTECEGPLTIVSSGDGKTDSLPVPTFNSLNMVS